MQLSDVFSDALSCDESLNWSEFFGNDNPVEIEIGTGTGRFLSVEALNRPEVNFLGIEAASTWARNAARRILKKEIPNVKILSSEAARFLRDCVPDESVAAVHIYFPDPWPKRRHAKRRLLCTDFVDDLVRILISGGRIEFATDIKGYFIHVQGLLDSRPELRQRIGRGGATRSGYAKKFLDVGRPIFQTSFEKR